MAQKPTSTHSLTSDFQQKASPEDKRNRRETEDAADKRTEDNRRALGNWHNESRGKPSEIPMPKRRTT
jgi:hypothetical protein